MYQPENYLGAGSSAQDPRFDVKTHQIPAELGYTHFVGDFVVQKPFAVGPQGGYKPLQMYIVPDPKLMTTEALKLGVFVFGDVNGKPKVIEVKEGVIVKLGEPHPIYQKFCELVAKGALPINDIYQYVPCDNSKAERMAACYPGKRFAEITYKYPEAVDPTSVNAVNHKVIVAMTKDGVGAVLDDGSVVAINPCCLESNAWPMSWGNTSGQYQLHSKMVNKKYTGTSVASNQEMLKVEKVEGIGLFPCFLVGDVTVVDDQKALFAFAEELRML